MSIDQIRARVNARVWQAVAQSGVDISALPSDSQAQLFGAIADGVLLEVNALLGEAGGTPTAPAEPAADPTADPSAEQVLWEGRPFLSVVEHYTVTSERVRIRRGMLAQDVEDVELIRLQDIDVNRTLGERMFNLGDITLRSADASKPSVVLRNVTDPEALHETIRRAWLAARKRYGIQFREQM